MAISTTTTLLLTVAIVLLLASPAHAFGAGNIASLSKVEGVNWRHGDIEDTLLQLAMSRAAGGKHFDKMMIARVYFGNWLRDYSQAIDVGTVKYVSAEAIRILLWVLGFMTFGYGTKEFEVTTERLGCYRPEDHIDNPKDYADNLDARDYDPRLRGPVNERVELGIDERRGMKNYIASEGLGIMTSAEHVRKLFTEAIRLGRSYARSGNKAEWYEALRLLGTGTHCLEDFSAHSNYTELALIEMGERDVFPHVGSRTQIRLEGARSSVYPLITGTFGGVDFLHSMMGEFDDKATQSEIQTLEQTIQDGSQANTSMLKTLLDKIPDGLFGGSDQKGKADQLQQESNTAAMQNMRVTPKRPEAFVGQMQEIVQQIYPIMEYHDEIMQQITEAIEKIPILPELLEQLENEVNVFVFSLMAPFVLPLIQQLKTELNEGSSEVIASSKDKQHIVFNDDNCTDPTHSMLSKDHFSNVLNEPAGKIASSVLKWAVPQIIAAMDDERVDVDRTCSRIINGVFHHPAQRNMGDDGASDCRRIMYGIVTSWWQGNGHQEQEDLRRQLSRDGVLNGDNHKPGEYDTGHGSAGGLKMHAHAEGCGAGEGMIGELLSALGGNAGQIGAGYGRPTSGGRDMGSSSAISSGVEQAVGGGALGGLLGGIIGGVLGGGDDNKTQSYGKQYQTSDGGVTQEYTEVGRHGQQYGQAQYQQTTYPSGRVEETYKKYGQQDDDRSGVGAGNYGYEARVQSQPDGYGGYEQKVEKTYRSEGRSGTYEDKRHSGGYGRNKDDSEDDNSNDDDDDWKKQKKREKKERKRREERERRGSNVSNEDRRRSGGYGGQYGAPPPREEYGGGGGGGYGAPPPGQEYGGGGGGRYGRSPPREQYGGRDGGYGGGNEYGRGGGGFEAPPPRADFGGGNEYGRQEQGMPGGFENEQRGGYGQREEEFEQPRREGGWGGDGGYEQEERRGW